MRKVDRPLLVTGASGHLGRLVLGELLARGAGPIVATTRTPDGLADFAKRGVDVRRADFDDPAGLEAAFRGARRALLISTDAIERPGRRVGQHAAALRAFVAAGVEHVVYTSLPNPVGSPVALGADHAATEQGVMASGLGYTILRNNLYADYLVPSLADALSSGRYVDARGGGRVAWVTRADCARAAAGALAGAAGNEVLDVTGPEALTSADVAALAAEFTGKPVAHVALAARELEASMAGRGTPAALAAIFASLDVGVERGLFANVTDTVLRYGGRAPERVRDFLASTPLAQ